MRYLKEVVLGCGDYAAGGSCSLPFLEQDGARRRRPLVFGEVTLAPPSDRTLEEMFSGRASDPVEWSVMWKEIGADGICLRLKDADPEIACSVSKAISERTRLPLMVDGAASGDVGDAIDDTVLLLSGCAPRGIHASAVPAGSATSADRAGSIILVECAYPDREPFDIMSELRRRALNGDSDCDAPLAADVTSAYPHGGDARGASMREGTAALAAMSCGADMVIVKGPGAADMARVYGEELADL